MQKIHCPVMLGIAVFVLCSVPIGASEYGDTPVNNCTSMRIPGKCKPEPLSPEHNQQEQVISLPELAIKKKIALPPQQFKGAENLCEATYSTSYDQRNDTVRVSTGITNPTCGESHGEFEIRIKTMDEQREPITRSFVEQWSRADAENVLLKANYPMGKGVDLVWVRVRSKQRTSCVCD